MQMHIYTFTTGRPVVLKYADDMGRDIEVNTEHIYADMWDVYEESGVLNVLVFSAFMDFIFVIVFIFNQDNVNACQLYEDMCDVYEFSGVLNIYVSTLI